MIKQYNRKKYIPINPNIVACTSLITIVYVQILIFIDDKLKLQSNFYVILLKMISLKFFRGSRLFCRQSCQILKGK